MFNRLDEPEFVEIWLQCFATLARAKYLKDKASERENEITDIFRASADCEAIMKIYVMAYTKQLEKLSFVEI